MKCTDEVPTNLIVGSKTYLDTVKVLLPRRAPYGDLLSIVKPLCRGKVWPDASYEVTGYRVVIFQRPTREALEILGSVPGIKLHHVHVALDLLVDTHQAAAQLGDWVRRQIVQPHGRQGTSGFGACHYTGPGRSGVNTMVIYSDKPSKISEDHCVHIEFRLQGCSKVTAVCKKKNPAELLNLDITQFWSRRLKLVAGLDRRVLMLRCCRIYGDNPELAHRRIGLLLRVAFYQDPNLDHNNCSGTPETMYANDVAIALRSKWLEPLNSRRALKPIDTKSWLPTSWSW